RITTVQPTSKGDILVGDFTTKKFFVFNPNGDLVGEIGKEGSGPGEFQFLGKSYVGQNDSLFVMDWSNARISAFTETAPGKWTHQLDIPMVQEEGARLNGFFHFGEQGLIGQYQQSFSPTEPTPTDWPYIAKINRKGEKVGDKIVTFRYTDMKMNRTTNMIAIYSIPIGKSGFVRESSNALHTANNEYFGSTMYNLEGDTLNHFRLNVVDRPVTEDIIFQVFNGNLDSDYYKAVKDELPSLMPAFDEFQVDNQGNSYFQFEYFNETDDLWLKFTPDGELVASFTIPKGTIIQRIYNNKIYSSAGEDDVPYIVVYELIKN
ncbi:MAG TPA: hypothetical protein DCE78_04065, partial [Bacteroidetes bacterium]|nr:hypothetical protein [Bacteroidota bacterium]